MSNLPRSFGINGFGRIGRTALRAWWLRNKQAAKLKVINTSGSMEVEGWAHLLKYDTNYGVFIPNIKTEHIQDVANATADNPIIGKIFVDNHEIVITAQRDPNLIPWQKLGVDVVIESTGAFTTQEKAAAHLNGGAKYVIISAPAKGGEIPTGVLGANSLPNAAQIVSNASCTTNNVAVVAQVLHNAIGISKAMLTTVHAYTDDQNVQDNSHKDLRRARTAGQNIIPTSTGAAKTTTEIVTDLAGVFDGLALRVPVSVGSLSDMVFVTKKPTTIAEVNAVLIAASQENRWKNILATTTDQIVSSDIIGRPESAIVDLSLTNVVGGDLVKVISWYDNEYGYCCRLIEQVTKVGMYAGGV